MRAGLVTTNTGTHLQIQMIPELVVRKAIHQV